MPRLSVIFRLAFLALIAIQLSACGSPEDRAKRHYERGMELLASNDHVKAMLEFKNALQLKGDLVGAWRGLAQIEESKQNWEALFKILPKIAELDPKDVETKLRLARLMLLANALDDALKNVDAAIELDGKHVGARVLRAAVLFKLNDNKGAIREAQTALEADPGNAEAHIVLAAERLGQGDSDGALALLDRPKASGKDHIGIQLFKLKIYERKGDFQRVESLLQELVKANPKENAYRRQLVKLYVDQKRPADAERELRAIAAEHPTDHQAGLDVARYLFTTKGAAAARAELQTRAGGAGEVFQYQIALADLYFAEGNAAEAEQLLEKLAAGGARSTDEALSARAKLAELHFKSKKLESAEALVSAIIEKDSRNVQGLKLRASIHMARGNNPAAVTDLRQALHDQPRSVDLNSLLAVAYERAGSIELAEKQFADTVRLSNFDARAGLNYVAFLRRRGSLARAEDTLVELTSRTPGNLEVLATLAEVRLARQNWPGAQEVADGMRRAGDKRGIADQVLGAALAGQKKYDESIGVLQAAYSAAPNDAQPMFAVVNALVRAQKLDRAMAFLRTVLDKDPGNAEALVLMGSIHLMKNAAEEARKSFEQAIARQPKKTIGHRALADLHLRQKRTDEALKVIQQALQAQPDSIAMRLVLAGVLEGKADYEGAIAEYEQMLKQEPGSMVVANNLASLLTDYRNDRTSHERAYTLALALRKTQIPQFKDTLGWVHYHRGEHKAAQTYLEEAVAELPNVALVRYHHGMNFIALGEPAKAEEQLKKALESAAGNRVLEEKIRTALQRPSNN
jgi:tetratricopeptide (TPR) repeat protein